MSICQFFLRGQCKFGSNCRNEHPSGGVSKSVSFGGLTKSSFGSSGTNNFSKWQGATNGQDSVDKTIVNIKNEMLLWESSKMWLFSCFSHQKESQCLSGLVDQSPEELRLAAYIAKEKGTTNEYFNSIKQLNTQFMARRAELKTLTATSWEQELRKISSGTTNSAGLFQSMSSSGSSLLPTQSNLFSDKNSQGGAANPFAPTTTKPSLFSSSKSQSLFNGQSTFGSGQSSLFSSSQQASSGSGQQSAFSSGQQSAFGSGQQSSFGSGQQSLFSSKSNFGSQPTNSLFGSSSSGLFSSAQQQQASNTMQNTSSNGLFSQQNPHSQVPSQQQPKNSLFTQQNLFGQNSQQQSSAFGQQTGGLFATQSTGGVSQPVQDTGRALIMKDIKGINRGRCASLSCSCDEYVIENKRQTRCCYCDCAPAMHENQGVFLINSQTQSSASQNPFLQAAMLQKQAAPTVAEIPSTLKISEKDLEAFKADKFICGQIPECPPPPELC